MIKNKKLIKTVDISNSIKIELFSHLFIFKFILFLRTFIFYFILFLSYFALLYFVLFYLILSYFIWTLLCFSSNYFINIYCVQTRWKWHIKAIMANYKYRRVREYCYSIKWWFCPQFTAIFFFCVRAFWSLGGSKNGRPISRDCI